jgi:hypothetical protein
VIKEQLISIVILVHTRIFNALDDFISIFEQHGIHKHHKLALLFWQQ